jgi:hypothetical protein
MIAEQGERWRVEWLRVRGLNDWADYLDRFYSQAEAAALHMHPMNGYHNGRGEYAEVSA